MTPLTEAGCCIENTTEMLQAVRESKRGCNTLESVVNAHLEGGGLQLPSLLLGFLRHFFFRWPLGGKKKYCPGNKGDCVLCKNHMPFCPKLIASH